MKYKHLKIRKNIYKYSKCIKYAEHRQRQYIMSYNPSAD